MSPAEILLFAQSPRGNAALLAKAIFDATGVTPRESLDAVTEIYSLLRGRANPARFQIQFAHHLDRLKTVCEACDVMIEFL